MADKKPIEENPCPNCGGGSFVWGIARGEGGGSIDFVIGESFLEQVKKNWAPRKTRARHCVSCGNLQLFVQD